jgi:protein-S-isoprenylcysteine O-methyltransferase Ste14
MSRTKLIHWAGMTGTIATLLMVIAGTWTDPWLWAYMTVWGGIGLVTFLSMDDDLVRERFHPPEPGADRIPLRIVRLLALAFLVLGALDVGRWHLLPVPTALRVAGLFGMAAASSLIVMSMRANRFFSAVVRVQRDRGHHVIDSGPYARIRHPGYAGMILAIPCGGLALGSWFSVAIAVLCAAMLLRRVMFEDRFLQANLEGYREYAVAVKSRLVPGGW